MRVLFVQYSGDFLAAYRMLQNSGSENYYGHRYLLETLEKVATVAEDVAILCCISPTPHDERLPTGVRVLGAGPQRKWDNAEVWRLIHSFAPTHIVVLAPLPSIIRWGLQNRCRLLCILADSFEISPLRRFIRYGRLPALLNDKRISWVSNHGVNACVSLQNYGVSEDKIVPWDWPHVRSPREYKSKVSAGKGPWNLFFAGSITERKGVRDIIAAVKVMKEHGRPVSAKLAGSGEIELFRDVARQQGVSSEIEFLGPIPNSSIIDHMRAAAVVVVPSQHTYPEGLPLTIYEALCARTPIVASDHPMFLRRLVNEESALIYSSQRPQELAHAVERLLDDQTLYARISDASELAWDALQLPVKWGELVTRWIRDDDQDRDWLYQHRLGSGRYSR